MKFGIRYCCTHPWPLPGGKTPLYFLRKRQWRWTSPPGRGQGWVNSLITLLLLIISNTPLFTQPIPCNGDLYLAVAETAGANSSILHGQWESSSNQFRWDTLVANTGRHITALGYRVTDQALYGLDGDSFELVRIDGGGNVFSLGAALLDSNYTYRGGEITPTGNRFVIMGKDKNTDIDREMFLIRLERQELFAARQSLLSEMPTQIEDLAFSPQYGVLYGFDRNLEKLVKVNWIFGQITDFRFQTPKQNAIIRGLFYAQPGQLLGYGTTGTDETNESLFQIDELTGQSSVVEAGPLSKSTDGCSCGYQVRFQKSILPSQALPCDTVTIVYEVENAAGFGLRGLFLRDTLPPDLTVLEYTRLPQGSYVEIPEGSSEVGIIFQDFLLGKDSLVVRARVSENADQTVESQAWFQPFLAAFGGEISSDDPTTSLVNDPTQLELSPLKVEIKGDSLICAGQTTTLTATFNVSRSDLKYDWNTGDTGSTLRVDQEGWYSVMVNSECQTAVDSIFVKEATDVIFVDLGPDLRVSWGERVQLEAETNATEVRQYRWAASSGTLSCTDCPNPEAIPLETTTYTLTLVDEFGCIATDELVIEVEKGLDVGNVFTPNNDGINDVFFIRGKGQLQVRELQFYDRWGSKVFVSPGGMINDPSHGWDGQRKGKPVPEGIYFWQAELLLPDGNHQRLRGQVMLLR